MFHAVSLEADSELAKVLAFSAPVLAEGVRRVESVDLELTAIVEPIRAIQDDEERMAQYRFAVETMETQKIRVLTTNDLTRVAETAQRELRV
jgi:predicted Zn-dependent peptidase